MIDRQAYTGFTGDAGEIGYLPTVLSGDPTGNDETPHVGTRFRLPHLYQRLRSEGRHLSLVNPSVQVRRILTVGAMVHAADVLDEWLEPPVAAV